MRVLLSAHELYGNIEPMVGLAVQWRERDAVDEGCGARLTTCVVPIGVWR